MTTSRLRARLCRAVNLKPGEETISVLLFLYFFLLQAPYYIVKPLRNASFLEQLGGVYLPLPYFLTALLMGFIVNFHSRMQAKISRYRLLVFSLLFFFSNICFFWWFFEKSWRWVPVAFWVWANIFAVVLVTQFWTLVSDVFNPREAKRLIGFIGSGGLLGSIFGSLIEGSLAKTRAGDSLLLMAAGMMLLSLLVVHSIFALQKRRPREAEAGRGAREERDFRPERVGFRDAWATVNKSSYLKLLAGIVMITWVVSALVDFQFNNVVEHRIQGGANLKSFFGFFNAGTMAFAFFFQLLLTSRIIRNFGIRLTLLFYPLIMLLCAGGIGTMAFASLVPAILIKASDKSLAYSLNQSVRELLYIPISPDEKYKAKAFIDMFLNRFAKGLGAVLLVPIVLLAPGESGIRTISLVVVCLIAVWMALNLRVSREYTNTIKDKIKPRWERADWLISQKVDVDYTKLVFDTLESRERSSVLYAMHLFDLIRQDKLTPELRRLISYKSDEVRAASLGTLFEQGETGLAPRTEDDWSEDLLKKEVHEIMNLDVYQRVIQDYVEKRAEKPGEEGRVARMETAKAIGFMDPQAPLAEKLADFLEDESSEVVRYAVRSAAELKRREDVPLLVNTLRNPRLREDTIDALKKIGPKIVGSLADYLDDRTEDLEIRRAVASVLAAFGTQEAADFLSWALAGAEGVLADEVIDALDRLRTENPALLFPKDVIKPRVIEEARRYCRDLLRRQEEETTDKARPADPQWERRQAESLENIFKLLGFIYPHEDMLKAYQNLNTGAKEAVAYALELLDNVLERELREVVFPLIEDLPPEERIRRCRSLWSHLPEGKGGHEQS